VSESELKIYYIIIGGLVWIIASLVVARIQYQSGYTYHAECAIIWAVLCWPFIVMWLIVVWEGKNK
jgi:hypothetical protein